MEYFANTEYAIADIHELMTSIISCNMDISDKILICELNKRLHTDIRFDLTCIAILYPFNFEIQTEQIMEDIKDYSNILINKINNTK